VFVHRNVSLAYGQLSIMQNGLSQCGRNGYVHLNDVQYLDFQDPKEHAHHRRR
jgi:hypothetical protein